MPELIHEQDGGGQARSYHERILTNNLAQSISDLRIEHDDELRLAPAGAVTSGEGAFDATEYAQQNQKAHIVELVAHTPSEPKIVHAKPLELLATDEIHIDTEKCTISVGAGITLEQINQVLMEQLGREFQVLGADLTSFRSATTGGTFATNGMGPQRIRFADQITAISLLDENGTPRYVADRQELAAHAGAYGATGMISAVEMLYFELPREELGFTIPVQDTSEGIASITHALSPLTQLRIDGNTVIGNDKQHTWINGIEIITKSALEMVLKEKEGNELVRQKAATLIQKCEATNTDALIFISGRSDTTFENLEDLYTTLYEQCGEMAMDHSMDFGQSKGDMDLMRDIREAAPTAARRQGAQNYKKHEIKRDHTDIDVQLPPSAPLEAHIAALQAYESHRAAIDQLAIAVRDQVEVTLDRYGHVNPAGYDIHHRVTIASHSADALNQANEESKKIYYQLVRDLFSVAAEHGGTVLRGGEKSAGSEQKIIAAFGGVEHLPVGALRDLIFAQRAAVAAAHPTYSWRAFPHLQPEQTA